MADFYGIDLGTTYSCIAKIDSDDIVSVIPNGTGLMTTPSVVAFDDDGKILVGRAAKNLLGSKPENVVALIKRGMSNKGFTRTIQGKTYDPVDISSFILKELVRFANQQRKDEEGKDPIYDVVITVPAYFGNLECERTEAAGKKAGLNVLQLIHEPTAAALFYGKKNQSNKTILVYDLGGGTFDVSILKIQNGILDTIATTGDHHLGGADWDKAIAEYALNQIGVDFNTLTTQEQGMMMIAAEDCKLTLTDQEKTTITFSYKGIRNVEITKKDFESFTESLMGRTMLLVDEALALAQIQLNAIEEIILVGGSTRMPMVKKTVASKFNKEPKIFEPDMAVAKGAALMAAQNEKGYVKGALVMGQDKGSRAYGMAAYDSSGVERVFNLIMRNDNLEVHKENNDFQTMEDGQTRLDFRFYENESMEEIIDVDPDQELKGRNDYIEWGCPVPKNTPVKIIVDRDKSGKIKVYAECHGATGEFVIVSPGCDSIERH